MPEEKAQVSTPCSKPVMSSFEVLASRVLLSRVIKSGGLPQPNVSKGGRLIDGEADSLGFLMKSMRYMDTSGIKVIGHVQFSLSESRVSTRYVDMK